MVPHIFMHRDILPQVIFSPGRLAISLADSLADLGAEIILYTPGPVETRAQNISTDLRYFDEELEGRGDTYLDLLKKHPFTFITLARQTQADLISEAYRAANDDKHDIVHVYTNEEELGYVFSGLCSKPTIFTHHDPFNFLVKYKNHLPKYKHLNWLSMSYAQREGMPSDTNWVGNIYHGLSDDKLLPVSSPSRDYVAYIGRIIEPKGVHLAIEAVRYYNRTCTDKPPLVLKIAGKHYADSSKDQYWSEVIEPQLGDDVEHVGFIATQDEKRQFLGNAYATIVPSIFNEPFGMVTIESFACGTPVVATNSGALSEVIEHGVTGYVAKINDDQPRVAEELGSYLGMVDELDPSRCIEAYAKHYTSGRMAKQHLDVYKELVKQSQDLS